MNYQFKTRCGHHGSIKPVRSTTGKHAGKWTCRIGGPIVVSKGMSVKTIYTAPYIGAAKTSIASFLCVSFSEVVAVAETSQPPSSGSVGTPISGLRGGEVSTPQPSFELDEFDGDDEELANFDLDAAVSSAKKQSPVVANQQAPTSVAVCANWSNKPPQYPKSIGNLKSPGHHSAKVNLLSSIEKTTPLNDTLLQRELVTLRSKKERLQNELLSAKRKKAKLEKEAVDIREDCESLRNESEKAQKQRDKLKGQTRAMREEYEKFDNDLKSARERKEKAEKGARVACEQKQMYETENDKLRNDLKSVRQRKDKAEKDVLFALEQKQKYETETKAAKQAIDSRRTELECLAKQVTQSKSTGERSSTEPSPKKRKTGKQAKSGTVVKSMKVAELKEEAMARGIELKEISKMNKEKLLNYLVVGSPCIIKTDAWSEVLRLREQFACERRKVQELEDHLREEMYRRQEQEEIKRAEEEMARQKKLAAQREENRAREVSAQMEKHTHHYPAVHKCKLAASEDLLFYELPRRHRANCSDCGSGFNGVAFTCEKCDYDICRTCFKEKTMTPAEKKAEAKRKAALEKQQREEEAERRRLEEQEEEEHRKKWDPKEQFKSKIINPPKKSLKPDGNKKKGFTVWCSDGYGNDGWHSYDGPPDKEFESTYTTKEDANARARYLFYWKNPWGLGPEEIMERGEVDKSMNDGLVTYVVTPDDSSTWTVAVVPDAAYAYLDHATQRRHGHDGELGPTASDMGYGSFF